MKYSPLDFLMDSNKLEFSKFKESVKQWNVFVIKGDMKHEKKRSPYDKFTFICIVYYLFYLLFTYYM